MTSWVINAGILNLPSSGCFTLQIVLMNMFCEARASPFPKRQIVDSSKLKEFADDNFKFDGDGEKFFKRVETQWEKEKLLIMSNFSFSRSVFKRYVLQTRKNQGLFGKG